MWYAIVFNEMGAQIFKSQLFPNSFMPTQWAKGVIGNHKGWTYQLFQQ